MQQVPVQAITLCKQASKQGRITSPRDTGADCDRQAIKTQYHLPSQTFYCSAFSADYPTTAAAAAAATFGLFTLDPLFHLNLDTDSAAANW